MGLRRRIHEVLEECRPGDGLSRVVDLALMALIVANVAVFVIGTVPSVERRFAAPLLFFELASVGIFTVEYLLRLWSCTVEPRFSRPVSGRIRYAFQPLLLIDLLAILPVYLPFLGVDLRAFRIVRLVRLLRLLKLARYSEGLRSLGRVFVRKRAELLSLAAVLGVLLLLSSSLMYFAEREAQPEVFSSVPASAWWGIATLTTVGYGDVAPITPLGKLLGSVIAIIGIAVFALPTAILGSAFVEEYGKSRRPPSLCPHCGEALEGTLPRAQGEAT